MSSTERAGSCNGAIFAGNGPAPGWNAVAFELSGGPSAASTARRLLLASDVAVPTPVRDDVLLLVTELVTNAVRHGDVGPERSLSVKLERQRGWVRVEVADPGAWVEPAPTVAGLDGGGGWGLVLVERIADRWGIANREDSTCVWFELAVAA